MQRNPRYLVACKIERGTEHTWSGEEKPKSLNHCASDDVRSMKVEYDIPETSKCCYFDKTNFKGKKVCLEHGKHYELKGVKSVICDLHSSAKLQTDVEGGATCNVFGGETVADVSKCVNRDSNGLLFKKGACRDDNMGAQETGGWRDCNKVKDECFKNKDWSAYIYNKKTGLCSLALKNKMNVKNTYWGHYKCYYKYD